MKCFAVIKQSKFIPGSIEDAEKICKQGCTDDKSEFEIIYESSEFTFACDVLEKENCSYEYDNDKQGFLVTECFVSEIEYNEDDKSSISSSVPLEYAKWK